MIDQAAPESIVGTGLLLAGLWIRAAPDKPTGTPENSINSISAAAASYRLQVSRRIAAQTPHMVPALPWINRCSDDYPGHRLRQS
jgi:hypothetical protein